jgi:hypothetical protein
MVRAIAGEIGAVGSLTNAPSAGHELPKWGCLIYLLLMSTVTEIETALQTLPIEDARRVADWLQRYLDEKWDRQIDEDIAAGRLDKLADKALQDYHAGRVKPLDEIVDQS